MKGLSKCHTYFALFSILAGIGLAAFLPASSAFAASPYDDLIKTASSLQLVNGSSSQTVTNTYVSIMNEKCHDGYTSFASTLSDDNGHWAIRQYEDSSSGYKEVRIAWIITATPSSEFYNVSDVYAYHVFAPKFVDIYITEDGPQCSYHTDGGYTDLAFLNPSAPSVVFKIFLSTFPVEYPDGYEGTLIPDTPSGGTDSKPVIRPDFTYSANNKSISAKDYNQTLPSVTPDEGYTIQGYSVEWSLFKCGSWSSVGGMCSDPMLVNHAIQPQSQQYSYTVDNYGDYYLTAQYLVEQCYRYPSYPSTPDYCFNVDLGTELPDYDFDTTSVYLKIDGNTIAGDTKDGTCDSSGYCEPPSQYEDCSQYNATISTWSGVTL